LDFRSKPYDSHRGRKLQNRAAREWEKASRKGLSRAGRR
jgi:hypothetical protein